MKRLFLMTLAAAVMNADARLGEDNTRSWTGKPMSEVILNFPYGYKIGAELEVTDRGLSLLAQYFNWDRIQQTNKITHAEILIEHDLHPDLKDCGELAYTLDYITSKEILEDLRAQDPELVRQLTMGLNLDSTMKIEETSATSIRPEIRLRTDPKPLIITNRSILKPNEARPALATKKLILPKNFQRPTGNAGSLSADWKQLRHNWNQLPIEKRAQLIRLKYLDRRLQAQLLEYIIKNPEYGEAYLLESAPDWIKSLHAGVDRGGTIEFRHAKDKPMEDAVKFLSQTAEFAFQSAMYTTLANPAMDSNRDNGLHIHLSVESKDRDESIKPIAFTWNRLVLFKKLSAGILNVFGGPVGFDEGSGSRGMVALRDTHHVELRDHFTDPETEVAMWFELLKLSNVEAVKKIYRDWMPKLTEDQSRAIIFQAPQFYARLLVDPIIQAGGFIEMDKQKINQWITKYFYDAIARGEMKDPTKFEGLMTPETEKYLIELLRSRKDLLGSVPGALHFLIHNEPSSMKRFEILLMAVQELNLGGYDMALSLAFEREKAEVINHVLENKLKISKMLAQTMFHNLSVRSELSHPERLDQLALEQYGDYPGLVIPYFLKNGIRSESLVKKFGSSESHEPQGQMLAYLSFMNPKVIDRWTTVMFDTFSEEFSEILLPAQQLEFFKSLFESGHRGRAIKLLAEMSARKKRLYNKILMLVSREEFDKEPSLGYEVKRRLLAREKGAEQPFSETDFHLLMQWGISSKEIQRCVKAVIQNERTPSDKFWQVFNGLSWTDEEVRDVLFASEFSVGKNKFKKVIEELEKVVARYKLRPLEIRSARPASACEGALLNR